MSSANLEWRCANRPAIAFMVWLRQGRTYRIPKGHKLPSQLVVGRVASMSRVICWNCHPPPWPPASGPPPMLPRGPCRQVGSWVVVSSAILWSAACTSFHVPYTRLAMIGPITKATPIGWQTVDLRLCAERTSTSKAVISLTRLTGILTTITPKENVRSGAEKKAHVFPWTVPAHFSKCHLDSVQMASKCAGRHVS